MTDLVVSGIAGAAGGAVFGFLGWLEAAKSGEDFDFIKFLKSIVPPAVVGLGVGLATTDPVIAFLGGLGGKAVIDQAKRI